MPKSVRLILLSLLALAGCGGPTVIYDTVTPSAAQTIDSGQSVTLTASVFNDSSNAGVTWALNGAGTLSSQTSTSVVYTAPVSLSATGAASVTATPVKNTLFAASTQILLAPAPVITSYTLLPGVVGTGYSAQLSSSGGSAPLTWTLASGTLPAGLSFSSGGVISGTPTAAGSSTFTVKVTDSATTPLSSTQSLTLNVTAPALSISTSGLANGVTGTAYSTQLALTGGVAPYTWSVSTGALPAGITISAAGLLSGTPTAAGVYNVTMQVKDTEPAPQTAVKSYTFTIYNALAITTSSLAGGSLHNAYAATLHYTGGTVPVTWSLASGSLPAGLSLSSGGVISGTPTATGSSSFTVSASDSSTPKQMATANLSINVVLSTLAITTTSLTQGTVGASYTATLQSSGGNPPVTWALASGSAALPAGLTLSAAGTITGTPTTAGTYPITVQATDSTPASVTQTFSITVVALTTLTVSTTTIPAGNIGTAYTTSLAATGGAVPYTWSLISGTLPQGLSLSTNGVLSGTPLASGSYVFTIQVEDSQVTPATASRQFTLAIGTTLSTGVNNAQISGNYAFLLNGFNAGNSSGAVYGFATIGSLSANGAGVLTGVEYSNSPTGVQSAIALSGTYTLGSDGRGFMILSGGGNTNVFTIAAANLSSAGVAQSLAISEFDNSTGTTGAANATGIAKLQTASAFAASTLFGTFAFGLSGESPCSTCVTPSPLYGPVAAAGLFTANGVSTIGSGQEDAAAYSTNYNGITLTGSFTAPSATNGIGSLHLVSAGTLFSAPPANYVYAIVSANEMLLLSSDTHATTTLLSGDAQLQRQTTYSATSLTGTLVGYESQANGGNGSTSYPAALNAILSDFAITGSGTGTLGQDANRDGTFSSTAASPTAITYTTASNGRTAIVISGSSNQVLYLYNTDTGFALDQAATTAYPALIQYQQQVATAPYPVLLSGPYAASTIPTAVAATDVSGIYTFALNNGGVDSTISGDLTTTLESSSTQGSLAYDQTGSFPYLESSTGRHVATLSGSTVPQAIVYGINSGLAVAISATATSIPTVTLLQLY